MACTVYTVLFKVEIFCYWFSTLTFDIIIAEEMIRGLTQVTWERVDVCFHESRLKYNAHYNIQVGFKPSTTVAIYSLLPS